MKTDAGALPRILRLALPALCAAAPALGQGRVPRFRDCPAGEVHRGRPARLVLTPDGRAFRTRR